jgi:hypothetical protein
MSTFGIGQILTTVIINANTVELSIEISTGYFSRYPVLLIAEITWLRCCLFAVDTTLPIGASSKTGFINPGSWSL